MEARFAYEKQSAVMDRFFRDYLTVCLARIPKENRIYDEFKQMRRNRNLGIEDLCLEIHDYARRCTNLIYSKSGSSALDSAFRDIRDLKI